MGGEFQLASPPCADVVSTTPGFFLVRKEKRLLPYAPAGVALDDVGKFRFDIAV